MVCVPLSASTITRWNDEIAEDSKAQLLESINESPWYAIHTDKPTDVDNKATMLAFVWYIFQEDVHEDVLYALLLPTNTIAAELFKSLNDYISEKWIGHFVTVYARTGRLPWWDRFLVSPLESKKSLLNVSLCTVSSIEKCWIGKKCHLNFKTLCRMRWKLKPLQ